MSSKPPSAHAPLVLSGARVFDGKSFREGVSVTIVNGRIAGLGAAPADAGETIDLGGGLLAPGFVDLQVNGGGGVLFNSDTSEAAVGTIVAAHRRYGTTGILPTVISDSREVQRRAVQAVEAAMAGGNESVLGVHLEGPHLDAGKRGVHREEYFRPLDGAERNWLAALVQRMTVLVTLAPEHTPPDEINALAELGIRVSAGHTNAAYATVREAAESGLSGFTHLYNAMGGLGSREPGVVGAALDLDDCWCGIIVDGQHVSPAAVRLAYRAKPPGKLYLVSDAMATSGSSVTSFELYGETVAVVDGALRNREGRIAGSSITLADAVRIAHQDVGLPLDACLRMASLYPASYIGESQDRGRIRAGYRADLVHLDDDLTVRGAWVGGVAVDRGAA